MKQFQNYSHYKLPITMNPTEFGTVIEQFNNKYIVQLNTNNVAVIKEVGNENFVRFFRRGDLMFEFKDVRISDKRFIRTILDQKFTFENNKLISTEILSVHSWITIYKTSLENINCDINQNSSEISNTNNLITPLNKINLMKYISLDYICSTPLNFVLFKLSLISLIFILLFVIFPENEINMKLAGLSSKNIIKLRKREPIHKWESIEFTINNLLFTRKLFDSKFNSFWNKINRKFSDENHMYILFKIKYKWSDYTTIGNLQRINKNDKIWYLNWIINNIDFKSEYYNETPIESFIFSYGFKNEKIGDKDTLNPNINFQKYKYKNNLPISINPMDYGILINKTVLNNHTIYFLQDDRGQTISLRCYKEYNQIEIFKAGNKIIKFIDEVISENKFVRIIDNKKYYFENNKQVLFTKEIKSKFIRKLSPTKVLKNNFITLDLETYIKDSILMVYCISLYDGVNRRSYFLTDFKNQEELILTALKSIMIRKYNKTNVYIHNLAKFDIIFLLKYLVKLGSVKLIIHNKKIINVKFNYGKDNEYQIYFRDSYLILTAGLMKLCKSFNVENSKSVFPYFFVNENNLDYIGDVPEFKYFDNKINLKEYNKYKNNFNRDWNLKSETIKYCELDCISLHQVIFKFTEMIFDLFNKTVHHYPTLPSLAFGIFRSKFLSENLIPQLGGKIAKDIRQGYTGGSCDVYIPESKPGVKIKCYDVNSLYPAQMQSKLMPVGRPTLFEGDIRKMDKEAFGFFYCKIIAPDNIKHPILQTHVKTNSGLRTITPIGTWEDMLFSSEMDNARKYGYKFEILWGYIFKRDYIFKDYVDFLYNFRLSYPRTDPMNYSAKLLLNSLYGRFGMDDNFTEVNIIHKDYYPDFENKFIDNISSSEDLGDYNLVTYKLEENEDELTHNVNISIAAAITAYARIHMTQFKNNPDINLYYSDTDSIYTDSELDESFIDNKILGKLKLENICNKAIFLAPSHKCMNDLINNPV